MILKGGSWSVVVVVVRVGVVEWSRLSIFVLFLDFDGDGGCLVVVSSFIGWFVFFGFCLKVECWGFDYGEIVLGVLVCAFYGLAC